MSRNAKKARTTVSVLESRTYAGTKFELRKMIEHRSKSTAYVVRVTRNGEPTDGNFGSLASARDAYRRLMMAYAVVESR